MKILQNIKIALRRWMIRRHNDDSDVQKASFVDFTRTMVKCALDNSNLNYTFDDEDDRFYSLVSVEDFGVLLMLKPEVNHIFAQVFQPGRTIAPLKLTEALLFCNRWNKSTVLLKAYIDDSRDILMGEMILTFGMESSEEFVRECLLKNIAVAIQEFFKEVAKQDFMSESTIENV